MGKNRTQLSEAQKAILGTAAIEEIIHDEAEADAAEAAAAATQAENITSAEGAVQDAGLVQEPQAEPIGEESPANDGVIEKVSIETPEVQSQGVEDKSAVAEEVITAPVVEDKIIESVVTAFVAPTQVAGNEFGSVGRRVISVLNDYAAKMAPRKPVTDAQIIQHQLGLYRAVIMTINDSDKDFTELFKQVLAFVEEHKNGVFHETRVFRGMDNIPLPENERRAFQRLLNLFKLVANPQSRGLALKQVDLISSLQYGISEAGRNRVLNFFHQ